MIRLRERWKQTWDQLLSDGRIHQTSFSSLTVWENQKRFVEQYAHGVGLDLGAGQLTFKDILGSRLDNYISMDVTKTHSRLSVIGSGEQIPLAEASLDTVFSSQVIEHVPHPWYFMSEIARTMKPGAVLILSAPFLFYLHGEPFDYFRFTPHALRKLAEENNLNVVECVKLGGLVALFFQFFQTALVGITYSIPVVRSVGWVTNRIINWMVRPLDKWFGLSSLMPIAVVIVAIKNQDRK